MIFLNLLNYFLAFLKKIDRFIAKILIWTISLVRPLLGTENICPFEVGCTNFAIFNLEEQSVPLAAWAIFKRVLSCNPIGIWIHKNKSKFIKS